MLKFLAVCFIALLHLRGLDAIQCFNGSGSPMAPFKLSEVECAEGILNCLKMVSSSEDGSSISLQYQCGTNAKKENSCIDQDPSYPPFDDDDNMDEYLDKEMKELEKDSEEQDEAIAEIIQGEGDEGIQVHTFPPNARISSSTKKKPQRKVGWTERVEETVERVKRETSPQEGSHIFCYCDKDLCNGSPSLTLGGTALISLLYILSHF